jgi:hypothetical protein
MGPLLGFVTAFFIGMSMTRKLVHLTLASVIRRNKKNERTSSFDLKILLFLQKNHRYFGIIALLSAFAHAALQFSITGSPSLTGATLIFLLLIQGLTGYMQENKKGNLRLVSTIHEFAPFLMIVLIVAHIILNSQPPL